MIASLVKENRIRLKLTQQELADQSTISLRSIQRIEKGEVLPRMHTLKVLAECLQFSLDELDPKQIPKTGYRKFFREITLCVLLVLVILLLSTAYLFQSATFPETHFEYCLYYAGVLITLFFSLCYLWKSDILSRMSGTHHKSS